MGRRNKIDWDEEIRKTEKIKRKGMLMSALSFAFTCAFIFGISRHSGIDVEIPKTVLFAGLFCVSCVIFAVIVKRRSHKNNDDD